MPLAPGTALQNGHYVIDALLEAAPNGHLYWGTHVAVGMPVFIQVLPVGTATQNDLSSLIARLEGMAFSPQSPLPKPFQLFRGDDQTLCLAIGTTSGSPWSTLCKHQPPLSTKQALTAIRLIAGSFTWLQEQGLSGFDLSPNRIWLSSDQTTVTLTGIPYAPQQSDTTGSAVAETPVPALAQLLLSFLTGQSFQPVTPGALDHVAMRHQLQQAAPHLSPVISAAIAQGLHSPERESPLTLQQWLDCLPDAGANYQVPTPSQQLTRSHPPRQPKVPTAVQTSPRQGSRLLPALAITALLAAIGGGALGTYWRLNAQSLPGAIRLDPQQSFPAQTGWTGDTPEAAFDAPYVPASNPPLRRETWYEQPTPSIDAALPETSVNSPVETVDAFDTPSLTDVTTPRTASPEPLIEPADQPSVVPSAPTPEATPPEILEAPNAAPLDSAPAAAPDVAPAESDVTGFSNPNEATTPPSPMTVPKAMPSAETATES